MHRRVRLAARSIALVGALLASASLVRSQDEAGDLARVVAALALAPDSLVAEIGAGDGALTLELARHIGASGHVFTTELGDSRVQALRSAVGASGLSQIEVVEAGPTSTNLGEACCDAIVMRDVYHHFGDPAAMNVSLRVSLKPSAFAKASAGRHAVMLASAH